MTKRALLIGCNYIATPSAKLNGCINDVVNVRNTLIDAYGFQSQNICFLRDDDSSKLPTKTNILNNLASMIGVCSPDDTLWVHYSGHGTQVRDTNGDETDGLDECIVPCNYNVAGVITDDELYNIIKNAKCQLMLFFDSCQSGTVCDLKFSINYKNGALVKSVNSPKVILNNNVIMLSGCTDSQSSSDTYNSMSNQGVGAFTNALLETLRANDHNVSILQLYSNLCVFLKSSGYSQVPVLSSSIASPNYQFARSNATRSVSAITPVTTIKITKSVRLGGRMSQIMGI